MDPAQLLVSVRPLAALGRRFLGPSWDRFLEEFTRAAGALSPKGFRRAGELLLLDLPGTPASLPGLRSAIESAEAAVGWTPHTGPAPLQLVVGRGPQPGTSFPPRVWELLRPGELYLSRELKSTWRSLLGQGELAHASLGREILGLAELRWGGPHAPGLLPFAAAPLLREGAECYCCGRNGHGPAYCPTKHLSASVHGLSALGQHALTGLGEAHLEALLQQEALLARCAEGLTPQEVRASPALALFVGGFDVMRLYQLRFLIHFAFGAEERWPGIRAPRREGPSSRSYLFLALDCLRVGRRAEAVTLLKDKTKMGTASQFYAAMGLAFAVLEEGGPKAMVPELAKAAKLATSREEHVYRLLLLSRSLEVLGDVEGAARHADEAAV